MAGKEGRTRSDRLDACYARHFIQKHPMLLSSWVFLLPIGPVVCRAWTTTTPTTRPNNRPSWSSYYSGHHHRRERRRRRDYCGRRTMTPPPPRLLSMTTTSPSYALFDDDDASSPSIVPPMPFRDETSFVLAGELPRVIASSSFSSSDAAESTPSSPMRQSPSSPHPLLSPPRAIPNPYGWMRDDTRTNDTVLDHLRAENEYGKRMTSHLDDLREGLYREVSKCLSSVVFFVSFFLFTSLSRFNHSQYDDVQLFVSSSCRASRKPITAPRR